MEESQSIEKSAPFKEAATAIARELNTELAPNRLVQLMAAVRAYSKVFEEFEDLIKAQVKRQVLKHGYQTTENGSRRLKVGNHMLEIQPMKTGYDSKKVEAALRAKGQQPEGWMDVTISDKVNEGSLREALRKGLFTSEELEALKHDLSYKVMPIRESENE